MRKIIRAARKCSKALGRLIDAVGDAVGETSDSAAVAAVTPAEREQWLRDFFTALGPESAEVYACAMVPTVVIHVNGEDLVADVRWHMPADKAAETRDMLAARAVAGPVTLANSPEYWRSRYESARAANVELAKSRERPAHVARCPGCDGPLSPDMGIAACDACEMFQCSKCLHWKGWDEGCAGDHPGWCDGCTPTESASHRMNGIRLPGMNHRGEIAAADMTPEHFERVAAWQYWHGGQWHDALVDDHDTASRWYEESQEGVSPRWRPAIFAQLDDEPAKPAAAACNCDQAIDLTRQLAELQAECTRAMDHLRDHCPETDPDAGVDVFAVDAVAALVERADVHQKNLKYTQRLWKADREALDAIRARIDELAAALQTGDTVLEQIAAEILRAVALQDERDPWSAPDAARIGEWTRTPDDALVERQERDAAALAKILAMLAEDSIDGAVRRLAAIMGHRLALIDLVALMSSEG